MNRRTRDRRDRPTSRPRGTGSRSPFDSLFGWLQKGASTSRQPDKGHTRSKDNGQNDGSGRRTNGLAISPRARSWAVGITGVCIVSAVLATLFVQGLMQGAPELTALKQLADGGGGVIYRYRTPKGSPALEMTADGRRPGRLVDMSQLPAYVPHAFMAIEDERFCSNSGIDARSLARSAIIDLEAGRYVQGGSTITQQLVRNVLLHSDVKQMSRKVQEIVLARRVNDAYSKAQVMQMYLTSLRYNGTAVGIENAAQLYFGKQAKDLSLSEAAILAAIINAPTPLNPFKHYAATWERAKKVLGKMYELGFLENGFERERGDSRICVADSQPVQPSANGWNVYQTVSAKPPGLAVSSDGDSWRFAYHYVYHHNNPSGENLIGFSSQNNVTVYIDLSLDHDAQQLAADVLDEAISAYSDSHGHIPLEGTLIAADGDGAVRAVVGARQYVKTDGYILERRQIGSVYKLLIYGAAMEAGATADSLCDDEPGLSSGIENHHSPGRSSLYLGPVPLENAFARSSNVVAARVANEVGYDRVAALARRVGFSYLSPNYPSWPLVAEASPYEVAQAVLPFANGGLVRHIHFVDGIQDENGKRLDHADPALAQPVFSQGALAAMARLGHAVVVANSGTGRRALVKGLWIAGKTGTTNESRDTWFASFGKNWVVVVWIGRPDNQPLSELMGGDLAAEIAGNFLRQQKLGWGQPLPEAPVETGEQPHFKGPAKYPPGDGCEAASALQ